MVEFCGDRWSDKPGLIIPARNAFKWRDLVGKGSSLFTTSLKFENATFDRDSDAYLLANNELTGPFGTDVPAIAEIDGRQCIQIEESISTISKYSESIDLIFGTGTNTYFTADVINDPLGNLTADKFCENDVDGNHRTNASTKTVPTIIDTEYVLSAFFKAGERSALRWAIDGRTFGINLVTGEFTVLGGTPNWYYIKECQNGWYYAAFSITATTTGDTPHLLYLCHTPYSYNHQGIDGYGLYIWGYNVIECPHDSSYIYAYSSVGSKAADKLEWSEAQCAANDWIRDRFAIAIYPSYDSDNIPSSDAVVFCYHDTGGYVMGYITPYDNTFKIYKEGVGIILTSAALTFEARKKMILTIECDDGANSRVRIFGSQGGGEYTGTSFAITNGSLELGSRDGAYQFDGKMSEPYRY